MDYLQCYLEEMNRVNTRYYTFVFLTKYFKIRQCLFKRC